MIERFAQFPRALAAKARSARLASGIPALLAHPDWGRPAPTVVWLHGRTVSKELDSGRYLRWIRAGIAACAIDLPGHGERLDEEFHSPRRTLDLIEQGVDEIDHVVEALADPQWNGVFDLDRLAIGGMSAGGMVTLRRLCDDHPFQCAAVEATTGAFECLYGREDGAGRGGIHPPERVARLDPMRRLGGWRPIPLLALHTEADRVVPIQCAREFLHALRGRYRAMGEPEDLIELRTWPETGAPDEHAGFGRYGSDAKNLQVEFLVRHLRPEPPQG